MLQLGEESPEMMKYRARLCCGRFRQLKSYRDLNFGHKLRIIKYYRAKELSLERKTHLMARESAIQLVLQISLIWGL